MTALGALSRERWRVLEPLLDAALELEPTRRASYVDRACGGDLPLRAELKALLEACELGANMLETPAVIAYAPLLTDVPAGPPMPVTLGGRYHIMREIGRGGMATVYLAHDPKHGRQVAVKTLRSEVARRSGRVRFAREIEIAAGLSHPHILPLHDSGEESVDENEPSLLYFVSPFAEGETLRDRLRREPRLSPNEVVHLGVEVARALDYAHRRGVIHLDIKPENILLHEGHAVVADFGIARAISLTGDGASEHGALPSSAPSVYSASSAVSSVLGTPSYMSPEQATNAPDVDARSDVYSLGCVLYELFTGVQPFVSLADRASKPSFAALAVHVPNELATVVMRALAPSPDDRFSTAEALATALERAARASATRWRRARLWLAIAAVTAAAGGLLATRVVPRHSQTLTSIPR